MFGWLFGKKKTTPKPATPVKPLEPVVETQRPEEKRKPRVLNFLRQFSGKTEFDSAFNRWLSGFWALIGLRGYNTIIGTKYAWCGLFLAAGMISVGLQPPDKSYSAKAWDKAGIGIHWQADGIPEGSAVRVKKAIGGNCDSTDGNHVTLADGDCAPKDLKSTDSFAGYGGNQGDTAKVSNYPVYRICAVRWIEDYPPPKITVSKNCRSGNTNNNESTR